MPEGHTLHRLANALAEAYTGRRVVVDSPQGRFADGAARLTGRVVEHASAHGKHLFVDVDSGLSWHVHLGLIGTLTLARLTGDPATDAPRGAVRARISDGTTIGDLRGPATCEVLTGDEVSGVVARLGPDPLRADADPDLAWTRIHRSGRPIAALLMDQAVLSGIGNVYRSEVLFRNRLDPHRPGNRLARRSWLAIWTDLTYLMPIGVSTGRIDTVRPEHEPDVMGREPRRDDHGGEVYVYRRAGQACHACGARIRTEVLEGRNLFWCGRCQRRG